MQISYYAAATNISNMGSSLADFYNLINKLSNVRFVRFTSKQDEADCIKWSFTYRKHQFVLHYSIYNGISLVPGDKEDEKMIIKLANKLHLT